eukprot:EG_transcript_24607
MPPRLWLLLALLLAAHPGPAAAAEFARDLAFAPVETEAELQQRVRQAHKPGMVFATQPWCGACNSLKESVSGHAGVRRLWDSFVVANVEGDASYPWQFPGETERYVPRIYFMDLQGNIMNLHGFNKQYPRFFAAGDAVEAAMREALRRAAAPPTAEAEAEL